MLLSLSAITGEVYEHHTIDLSKHIPLTMWQDSLFYLTHIAVDKDAVYVGGYYSLEQHKTSVARNTSFGPATGLNDNRQHKTGFRLFPNPGSSIFTIELPEETQADNVQIQVTNNLGQQVFEHTVPAPALRRQYEFDLRGQPAGIYMVEVKTPGHTSAAKLVKQ